jgi:hypothetical protein
MIQAVAMTDAVAMVAKQAVAKTQRTGIIPVLFSMKYQNLKI